MVYHLIIQLTSVIYMGPYSILITALIMYSVAQIHHFTALFIHFMALINHCTALIIHFTALP